MRRIIKTAGYTGDLVVDSWGPTTCGEITDGSVVTANIHKEGHEVSVKTESGEIIKCRVGVSEVEPVFAAYQVKGMT